MLYISTLRKGKDEKPKQHGGQKVGEQRGGKYIARIQTGYEKDGSPKYKYFETLEERDAYVAGQGRGAAKRDAKDLKDKVSKEHKKGAEEAKHDKNKEKKPKLYVSPEKKKAKDSSKKKLDKSVTHFIWKLDI